MTTLTLKINERSKKGKAFLAFATTFFDDNSDVEIVESDLNSSIKKNIYSQSFIDKILKSNCHIITSVRRKVDYSMDSDSNGKSKVIKHGTKEITREGFEYELTSNFEIINDKHLVRASKDRTGLFMDIPEFIINSSVGKKLFDWCNSGISLEDVKLEIKQSDSLEDLKIIYEKYPSLKKSTHSLIMERKEEIENINSQILSIEEIVQPLKTETNGISNKQ